MAYPKLSPIADRVMEQTTIHTSWESLRDLCDQMSGGKLPMSLLDKLTDMTQRRLRKNYLKG